MLRYKSISKLFDTPYCSAFKIEEKWEVVDQPKDPSLTYD
jgi:hypothetical protein